MRRVRLPFLAVCLFVVVLASTQTALGQPGNPAGGGDPDAPLTGIEILIGVGAMFGAKKIFEMKRNKK